MLRAVRIAKAQKNSNNPTPFRHTMLFLIRNYLGGFLLLALAGCVHVVDTKPQPEVSDRNPWPEMFADASGIERNRWWEDLSEPAISALVEEGLSGNLSLLSAKHRLRYAASLVKESRSFRFPDLAFSSRRAVDLDEEADLSEGGSLGLGGSYKVDVRGVLRMQVESREYRYRAQEDALELARLNLSASIVNAYRDCIARVSLSTYCGSGRLRL